MAIDLSAVWFVLVGALLTAYAILDGFDLGVGGVYWLIRGERQRRLALNAIGPFWDGNEVWLVVGGGALFAAFPKVYATVFSGFYLAFMLLLLALIFRAAAIEFRGQSEAPRWRQTWDLVFSAASLLAALLLGVALGNIAYGVPLDARGEYAGTFFTLLRPFPLLVGLTGVALFLQHGSLYLAYKTEGELQQSARRWARRCYAAFLLGYLALAIAAVCCLPHLTAPYRGSWLAYGMPLASALAVAAIPLALRCGRDGWAFLASALVILSLMALFGVGSFPHLVYSRPHPEYSLTVSNAASSPKTLSIMLLVVALGMPLVLAYTAAVYRIFRGKVRLEESSY